MSKLAALTRTTEERVPPAREGHRESTDEFLNYFERRLIAAVDNCRQLRLTDTSDSLRGQSEYFANGVKIIRWLKQMNQQRRGHARTRPSR